MDNFSSFFLGNNKNLTIFKNNKKLFEYISNVAEELLSLIKDFDCLSIKKLFTIL